MPRFFKHIICAFAAIACACSAAVANAEEAETQKKIKICNHPEHYQGLVKPEGMTAPDPDGKNPADPENDFFIFDPDPSAEYNARYSWPQPGGDGSAVTITYSYSNAMNGSLVGITNSEIRAATEEALALWASYAPLHFVEVEDAGPAVSDDTSYLAAGTPDIRIGHHSIDGTGGTLAHAYYPSSTYWGIAGDMHFDSGDLWGIDPSSGYDYLEVVLHELGHSLGLGHETTNSAIMNPYYGNRFSGLGTGALLADDQNGIQAIYGSGTGSVVPLREISGAIQDVAGDPLSGVTVNAGSLGSTTTDSNGEYSFKASQGEPYSISVSLSGYTFSSSPASGILSDDVTHNFTGSENFYSLSGTITVSGSPLSGVTVDGGSLGTQTTNSSGQYSFTGITPNTAYSIVPTLTGYTFTPSSASGTLSSTTTVNFTASAMDTDGDGLPDLLEDDYGSDPNNSDSDGDGLNDGDEVSRGTSPTNTDSDGDGVSDGQEVTDGSNPLDEGSGMPLLPTTLCGEWNGFFGGRMFNILEHVNMSNSSLSVSSTLYSLNGGNESSVNFSVASGSQYDLLVHDMRGRDTSSYGRLCSTIAGNAGDLDGRMVYYLPETSVAGDIGIASSGYQFAFALPFLSGRTGKQYVPFNTYQPSLNAGDTANLVANWIQISNLESSSKSGTLRFYDTAGELLGSEAKTIAGNGRSDVSAHQFGASRVGLVEWDPSDSLAEFQLRNVRYLYDNASGAESFDTAFQLAGKYGSGELLVVPVDTQEQTSVLEIANVKSVSTSVTVKVYGLFGVDGTVNQTVTFTLGPKASRHIIVNELLLESYGVATVDGASSGAIVATAMQYGRDSSGSVKFMYGISAEEALGTTLRGSYNSYLGQGCRMVVINGSSSAVTYGYSAKDSSNNTIVNMSGLTLPGYGASVIDLCAVAPTNTYGTVTIQADTPNTLFPVMLRHGANDDYRFPTPIRQ